MIFNAVLTLLFGLVELILSPLPNVPATPDAVVDGGQWVIDTVTGVASFLAVIFTTPLLTALILVVVASFSFTWVYHSVMWVVRKIPLINIK